VPGDQSGRSWGACVMGGVAKARLGGLITTTLQGNLSKAAGESLRASSFLRQTERGKTLGTRSPSFDQRHR